MNRAKHFAVTVVLVGGAIAVYAGLVYAAQIRKAHEAVQPTAAATSTAETATSTATTTPKKETDMPVLYEDKDITIYAPIIDGRQTQPEEWAPQSVEVNGIKNDGGSTLYYYEAPQQTQPAPTQSSAPQTFTPPREYTPLEIALDIVKLYDPNGSAEYYGDNKIRIYAFNGKSVTVDLVGDWQENLKITLRKIK